MSFLLSFFCIFPYTLIGRTWRSGRSLTTSSDFFVKIISCCFQRSVPDLIYHQYGICRMYSKENPKDFRLPVPCLYPWEWVMLLLSAEAAFKPGGPFFGEFTSENLSQGFIPGRPSLAYKGCWYSIFCTFAISLLENFPRFGFQTLFAGEYLKIQKSQLIRNILCMNYLADFIVFTECP